MSLVARRGDGESPHVHARRPRRENVVDMSFRAGFRPAVPPPPAALAWPAWTDRLAVEAGTPDGFLRFALRPALAPAADLPLFSTREDAK